MKKTITFLILVMMSISFTSCDKEDEKEPEVNKEELIEAHVWKGDVVKSYAGDTETGSISISDYEFTFDANKDYSITKNGNVEFSGTWEYVKGDPDLLKTTDTNNVTKEYTIDKIDDTHLELSIATSSQNTYKYFLIK